MERTQTSYEVALLLANGRENCMLTKKQASWLRDVTLNEWYRANSEFRTNGRSFEDVGHHFTLHIYPIGSGLLKFVPGHDK
jgi:hypothetical protein